MKSTNLERLKQLKTRVDGERVAFRANVLRFWEVGGLRMALVGDDSALVRVEIGDATLEEGRSYEFRDALAKTYPGGWHSLSLDNESVVAPLISEVRVSQSEAYIERTYKILAGVQRKKGRAAGRVAPWRHPAGRPENED
jgi:hypothetical protein